MRVSHLAMNLSDIAAERIAAAASHRAATRRLHALLTQASDTEAVRETRREVAVLEEEIDALTQASVEARNAFEDAIGAQRDARDNAS